MEKAFFTFQLLTIANASAMEYHLDFNQGGNAQRLKFLWDAIPDHLEDIATLTTQTNLAIQQIKHDKPDFALEFLRKQRSDWRAFRAQLNLWLQRNQSPRYSLERLRRSITAFNDNVKQSEEDIKLAEENFAELCVQLRARNTSCERPSTSEPSTRLD